MSVELKGKLVKKLEPVTGEGRNGKWEKQEFIIETDEQYPKKICISLWNDKLSLLDNIAEGDALTAYVNIESREYNSRWFTDIRAWRIERGSDENAAPPSLPEADLESFDSPEDDLPF